jgi:hypothetical protein
MVVSGRKWFNVHRLPPVAFRGNVVADSAIGRFFFASAVIVSSFARSRL